VSVSLYCSEDVYSVVLRE